MKQYLRRTGRRAPLMSLAAALLILAAAGAFADVEVSRRWASASPTINGVIAPGEWNVGVMTPLAHGRMYTMNNGQYLYVMLDVTDDTGNEPPAWHGPNTGDYYSLSFDVDRNHAITPMVDLDYDACNDGRVFIKSYYLDGGAFTGCRDVSPASQGAIGFGPTFNSAVPHRFWEFRLDLAEIGVDTSEWTTASGTVPHVRMNVGLHSETPAFESAQPDPSFFPDFTGSLYQLDLATYPAYPPGSTGPTFAGVGLVPRNFIDGLGYANLNVPGYMYSATAAPFGGNLNVFGNWNNLWFARGARSYRVRYSKDGGPLTRLRQTWTNFKFNGVTGNWDPVAVGPDANDRYPVPTPGEIWYLTNLLIAWQTSGFGDGTYTLSLELFNGAGVPLPNPPGNSLTLFVVNTPPAVKIDQALFNDAPVSACAIVTQGLDPDGFNFTISVNDANGALGGYSLIGYFGNNLNTGAIASDSYSAHPNADGPERWNGPGIITVPNPGRWRADTSCAYSFVLSAHSRSQNGYGLNFPYVDYRVSLTILLGGGLAAYAESAPLGAAGSAVQTEEPCMLGGRR